MASKIVTLEQHLDYEAIIQIAEIDDQDLLYLNFDNQALGGYFTAPVDCCRLAVHTTSFGSQ